MIDDIIKNAINNDKKHKKITLYTTLNKVSNQNNQDILILHTKHKQLKQKIKIMRIHFRFQA